MSRRNYFCLEGTADLVIGGKKTEHVKLERGDVARVDPGTLRAIGNKNAKRAVVLIAGACPHTYPAGMAHHDVIADLLSVVGEGSTGFKTPKYVESRQPLPDGDED